MPDVDTFVPFTEIATGTQPLLELVKLGDNPKLNNRVEELITEFEPQNLFSMILPREPALIKPFEIKVMKSYGRSLKIVFHFGYRPQRRIKKSKGKSISYEATTSSKPLMQLPILKCF